MESGQPKLNEFEIVRIIPIEALKLENETQEIATVPHTLGYTPAFIPYILDPNSGQYQAANNVIVNQTSGIVTLATNFFVTSTSVIMEVVAPSAGSFYAERLSVNAKVYLLRETANT